MERKSKVAQWCVLPSPCHSKGHSGSVDIDMCPFADHWYDEGVPSTTASSDWASHNSSSYGSKTSLAGGWATAVAEEYARQDGQRQGNAELNSLAESSRDAVARDLGEE